MTGIMIYIFQLKIKERLAFFFGKKKVSEEKEMENRFKLPIMTQNSRGVRSFLLTHCACRREETPDGTNVFGAVCAIDCRVCHSLS